MFKYQPKFEKLRKMADSGRFIRNPRPIRPFKIGLGMRSQRTWVSSVNTDMDRPVLAAGGASLSIIDRARSRRAFPSHRAVPPTDGGRNCSEKRIAAERPRPIGWGGSGNRRAKFQIHRYRQIENSGQKIHRRYHSAEFRECATILGRDRETDEAQ